MWPEYWWIFSRKHDYHFVENRIKYSTIFLTAPRKVVGEAQETHFKV